MRARIIRAALSSFVPDVFITDKHPRGLMRELDQALGDLRALGHTRFVLGLRDILDHPFAVRRDWLQDGNVETIRETYDTIWVYGDPRVYDPRSEYGFSSEISRKLRFTGYLDPSSRLLPNDLDGLDEKGMPEQFALCLVGGGQDGRDLARSFAEAVLSRRNLQGCLVTGPFMPRESKSELLALAGTDARLRVLDFVRNPGILLRRANRVVTMCGYNALTEALTLRVPVLGVPRVRPRVEQLIRARAFEERGLIDVLCPDDATSEAIASWLEIDMPSPPSAHERIDFKGLERLPMFLEDIVPARRVSGRQNGVRRS
ncbi:MAG TPA: glycosyltransferase [Candidatus Eisenbacteria bacterium]|nr:glycosyltransferase [Candidatus Eisenbacteria bacterium]